MGDLSIGEIQMTAGEMMVHGTCFVSGILSCTNSGFYVDGSLNARDIEAENGDVEIQGEQCTCTALVTSGSTFFMCNNLLGYPICILYDEGYWVINGRGEILGLQIDSYGGAYFTRLNNIGSTDLQNSTTSLTVQTDMFTDVLWNKSDLLSVYGSLSANYVNILAGTVQVSRDVYVTYDTGISEGASFLIAGAGTFAGSLTNEGILSYLGRKDQTSTFEMADSVTEQDAVVYTAVFQTLDIDLDLSALTKTTTVREYTKVDGSTYRLIDSAVYPTDFKGTVVNLSATQKNVDYKVTLQSAISEGAIREVPFNIYIDQFHASESEYELMLSHKYVPPIKLKK